MQPGLQQPGHNVKMFAGRRREDELKARGTFSCYHLPVPLWEKTLPAPVPSAGQEHQTIPSSCPGSVWHNTTVSGYTQSSAYPQPQTCHQLPSLAVVFHMSKQNSSEEWELAEWDPAKPGGVFLASLTAAAATPSPNAAAPQSPFLPHSGTDMSMLLLPHCTPVGTVPKCMGLPNLSVKGAGEPLGPWVQPFGDTSPSLQKHAEQPEAPRVPWPLLHAGSGVRQ